MKIMSTSLGSDIVSALVGLHPFTGCDSTSAFKGKGKWKALKTMLNDPMYIRVFNELGQEWTVPDVVIQELELFVCELYGWQDSAAVDDVRYNCFRFGTLSWVDCFGHRTVNQVEKYGHSTSMCSEECQLQM